MTMEQTLPKMVRHTAEMFPDMPAQYYRNAAGTFDPISYKDFFELALDFGGGLLSMGIKRGDRIGMISDNRKEWQQADIGLLSIGAVDVPRGCDATLIDLEKILSITECKTVIAENNTQVNKIFSLLDKLPNIKTIIHFDNDIKSEVKERSEERRVGKECRSRWSP